MFKRKEEGFTLIELLIVIVIIGILAGVLITVLNPAQQQLKARQAVLRSNTEKMCLALNACAATTGNAQDCDTIADLGVTSPNGTPPLAGGIAAAAYYVDGDGTPSDGDAAAAAQTSTVIVRGVYGTCRYQCGFDFNNDIPVAPTNALLSIPAGSTCAIGVE